MRNELNVWTFWSLVRLICSGWLKAFHSFKNKPGVAHLCYMTDEVWLEVKWGDPDLAQSHWFIRTCVNFPKKDTWAQMLRGWRVHVWPSGGGEVSLEHCPLSWERSRHCGHWAEPFSSWAFSFPEHPRGCAWWQHLPYRETTRPWKNCTWQIIKNTSV